MLKVAEAVKEPLSSRIADAIELKNYRALRALRAWKSGGISRITDAIRACPALAAHFPVGAHCGAGVPALCARVQNLHLALLDEQERGLDRGAARIPGETLGHAKKNITRKRELWAKMKRRAWLQAAIDRGGLPVVSAEQAAPTLSSDWFQIFAAPAEDPYVA
eukprot:6796060-Pyramimonas_sp.AAC.1